MEKCRYANNYAQIAEMLLEAHWDGRRRESSPETMARVSDLARQVAGFFLEGHFRFGRMDEDARSSAQLRAWLLFGTRRKLMPAGQQNLAGDLALLKVLAEAS